jgi:hypothetical protein
VSSDKSPRSVSQRRQQAHFDYLARQSLNFHFDSVRLAMEVLSLCRNVDEKNLWLQRIEDSADKCLGDLDNYTSQIQRTFPFAANT